MTLPNDVETRLDAYLQRIIYGAGEIPQIEKTRLDVYLRYIIDNGTYSEEQIKKMVAEEYNEAETYPLGAIVMHGGELYKSLAAIETPEPWTEAHWEKKTVAELIAEGGTRKPEGGWTKEDLSEDVQESLDSADSSYQKPNTGIPTTDLDQYIQESISKIYELISGVKAAGNLLTPDTDGSVNIPIANMSTPGVTKYSYNKGIVSEGGVVTAYNESDWIKRYRHSPLYSSAPITNDYLDMAVKEGLVNSSETWSDSDKQKVKKLTEIVKTSIDAILLPGTKYFLGLQNSLSLTFPNSAELGQQIEVVFFNGVVPCELTCSLDGFGFVPKPNTAVKIMFELIYISPSGDCSWVYSTKEWNNE